MCWLFTLLLGAQQFGYYDVEHRSTIAHPNWGSDFGRCVAVLGDLDGDLFSDFAVTASEGTGQDVSIYSGAANSLLFRLPMNYPSGRGAGHRSIAAAGDLTGDGVPDILARDRVRACLFSGADGTLVWESHPGGAEEGYFSITLFADITGDLIAEAVTCGHESVVILSGASGAILRTMPNPFRYPYGFGSGLHASGDMNLDGIPDILAGHADGGVALFDGASGALLRTHGANSSVNNGNAMSWIEDLDGDLYADYALPEYGNFYVDGDDVIIYSGATGLPILSFLRTEIFVEALTELGDQDGDGRREFAIAGDSYSNGVEVYSLPDLEPRWILASSQTYEESAAVSGGAEFNLQPGSDLVIGFPGSVYGSGSVEIWIGFQNPILTAAANSVSALPGGRVDLQLDFHEQESFYDYRLLCSTAAGTANLAGLTVPLSPSRLLIQTASGLYPPFAYWPKGKLDGAGDAEPYFDFLPGEASAWVGRTVWLAAASFRLDSNGQLLALGTSSLALPFTILP